MADTALPAGYTPRLKAKYRTEIKKSLGETFQYENVMQVPGVVKVVVNMVVGYAARDSKINGALGSHRSPARSRGSSGASRSRSSAA